MDTIAALRKYNRWRRGMDAWHEDAGPNPRDIGEQIDAAADELERLRDENGRLRSALRGMLALDEEHHQRCPGDEDVCAEVRAAREALQPND